MLQSSSAIQHNATCYRINRRQNINMIGETIDCAINVNVMTVPAGDFINA